MDNANYFFKTDDAYLLYLLRKWWFCLRITSRFYATQLLLASDDCGAYLVCLCFLSFLLFWTRSKTFSFWFLFMVLLHLQSSIRFIASEFVYNKIKLLFQGQGDDVDYIEPMLLDFHKSVKALQVSCGFNHTAGIFLCIWLKSNIFFCNVMFRAYHLEIFNEVNHIVASSFRVRENLQNYECYSRELLDGAEYDWGQ